MALMEEQNFKKKDIYDEYEASKDPDNDQYETSRSYGRPKKSDYSKAKQIDFMKQLNNMDFERSRDQQSVIEKSKEGSVRVKKTKEELEADKLVLEK